MILADTSVWVDYFRKGDAELVRQLEANNIAIHPFIVTELLLGKLPDRVKTAADLDLLPSVKVALNDEVRRMITAHSLFQRGIGFVDTHLIASALLTPGTFLWSRDRHLREIGDGMGIGAGLP